MGERQKVRFCTTSDGVRLAYAALGHGPPLVKAPNWLTHVEYEWKSPIWRHWLEGLSRHRTFIRYDARGCGLSDRDPPELSFETWVRDLEAVVDAMKLERFPLLGISGGGPIAIAYADRHPERVSHLVLYGAYARGRSFRGAAQAEEGCLMSKLIELGWGSSNRAFRQVFATQFLPEAPPALIDAFDELQRESSSARDALRMMEVSSTVEVSKPAARITCPTLIMHATGDGRIPFEEGRVLAALIPDSRFVPLESRNHILLEGEPAWQRFLAEVDEFLSPRGHAAFSELTARERELLEYLARGLDNHQIAAHLGLSEKTVRNHVSAILGKLGAETRAQAIVAAREAGFGTGAIG
jgi:pimeloyl-ACP methyl ester carboxylesterase/DNA-binding CsgD family transcriptional regulator